MNPASRQDGDRDDRSALDYLERIDTTTRGSAVLDALAEMIDRAGLSVGDRLPPEITLAEHLGVGRSTIREALNRWEGLGIIRRKRGSGTFLSARVQSSRGSVPALVRMEGEALLRLLEVRRALEQAVARLAATHATDRQRREIAKLCRTLLATVDARKPWRKADAAFHGAICEASGNPLFGQILSHLEDALERSKDSPFGRTDFGLPSFPFHQTLSDGIVAGDPDLAVEGVNRILDSVSAEIREIIGEEKGT